MKLIELQTILDREFKIDRTDENLIDFAVTDENKSFINPDFLSKKTALMTDNSENVDIVLTSVFITKEIVKKALQYRNVLILTHHQFDYFEDERGLQPIKPEYFEQLKKCGISIYAAHAPLDTHSIYGTSKSLAELCGIQAEKYFYDYFGEPTALIGIIPERSFDEYAEYVRNKLERPIITTEKHTESVRKIGVVAGGGDLPDILQQVYDYGCDTLLTGTIEHRWNVPFIQEGNKQFHELNHKLKLNLIGGTHFGTERPAMIKLAAYFDRLKIPCKYIEDTVLLDAV
ncbi:Nif3-like dinuclear metal center hexameric protein [Treponema brennaborense]|uniref:NGG1p interacting factor 3 protein, NIF3 n=1 Tax=Treponema brennaborense (strain DSM 12168 / CIP 105900 / DD5/3) TaxID=906968 RepID=F4LPK6_TREBD|nr:Nif3-like dinuclear metal center hexameric protein [Treponema brennaborense]AEE16017.1 NGG1p interacting factor 3 protein, NIF3 [Treponema brennaborense DSM 12168]